LTASELQSGQVAEPSIYHPKKKDKTVLQILFAEGHSAALRQFLKSALKKAKKSYGSLYTKNENDGIRRQKEFPHAYYTHS
jgi:muramidase (phage lysozyme)